LATTDSKPLAGKRVAVTRAPQQAAELCRLLKSLGAEVLECPLVAFLPPENSAPLDAALRALAGFDWLLFTSQNAVRFVAERCEALSLPVSGARPRVAAVGPVTARVAEEAGFWLTRVAAQSTGRALAEELKAELPGKRILLPRSDRAQADLPAALRRAGAEVTEVIAYRTVAPEGKAAAALEQVLRGEVDVITLASPSAFDRLAELAGADALRKLAEQVAFAAIGPVTAEAVARAGLPVAIQANEQSAAGLVGAIVEHFAKRMGQGVPHS
jgi:uroporphyrinogen-III synthase